MESCAIVMAAAEDDRMQTRETKVMLPVAGKPLVSWVRSALDGAFVRDQVYVVGYRQEEVRKCLGEDVVFVLQEKPLGTGHAVQVASPFLEGRQGLVVVVSADAPLIRSETINRLKLTFEKRQPALIVATAQVDDPTGYGRIVRAADGTIQAIVEENEATPEEKAIQEINTGLYCFAVADLIAVLPLIETRGSRENYRLTDVVALLRERGRAVETLAVDALELMRVNTRIDLVQASRALLMRNFERLSASGVTVISPETTFIEDSVVIGRDSTIFANCRILGETFIGEGSLIGPNTRLEDCYVGEGVALDETRAVRAHLGAGCRVGPYVSLGEDSTLEEGVEVASFVEITRSAIGAESRVLGQAYVADQTLGVDVTVGAGAVLACDGEGRGSVGEHSLIGARATVIGPLAIGVNALVAAGSVILEDVPDNALAIGRPRSELKEDWMRRPR